MAAEAKQIQIGLEEKERHETTFNELAHADASHDFHHYKVIDILEILASSTPLNSKLSFKQRALNINTTREGYGSLNIYQFFQEYLNTVLPDKTIKTKAALSEDEAMKMVGLNYSTGIRDILNKIEAANEEVQLLGDKKNDAKKEFKFFDKSGKKEIKRTYEVKAVRYRSGKSKKTVAQAFEAVSGGKKQFNLIVDAGYISISDLRIFERGGEEPISLIKKESEESEKIPYVFRFLKSIENESDSATKISNFEKPKEGDTPGNVEIYFLKDENNVGYFPTFDTDQQSANVFTDVPFETRRIGNKVLGAFQVKANKNYEIDDLSNASEKQAASILAMNKYIENMKIVAKTITVDDEIQKEMALHILSKRIGDWCQAICLLDKAREYTSSKLNFQPTGKYQESAVKDIVKLNDFPEAETAVLTHDQILLAYSILLGVDVFFTINTVNPAPGGGGWLIYFKNTLSSGVSVDQITKTKKLLETTLGELTTYIEIQHKTIVEAIKAKITPSSKKSTLLDYLEEIYKILYGLTELTPKKEFESLKTQIEDLQSKEPTEKDVDWYVNSKFTCQKVNQLIEDNRKQLTLEMPKNLEQSINDVLKHVKDGKSLLSTTVFMRFIEEIIKPFRERYLMIQSEYGEETTNLFVAIENYNESFLQIIESGRKRVANKQNNIREIRIKVNSIFDGKIILSGGAIRKDISENYDEYKKQLEESFNKIRQRRILFANTKGNLNRLLKEKNTKAAFETEINKKLSDSDYFIGLKGDYVKDRHGNYISIIDEYIVTPDDCDIFITESEQICKILEDLFEIDEIDEIDENKPFELDTKKFGINNRVLNDKKEDSSENHKYFFYEKYIDIRWKLLFLDILYTHIIKIDNEVKFIIEDFAEKDLEERIAILEAKKGKEEEKEAETDEVINELIKTGNIKGALDAIKAKITEDIDDYLQLNYFYINQNIKKIYNSFNKIFNDYNRNKTKIVASIRGASEKNKIDSIKHMIQLLRSSIFSEFYGVHLFYGSEYEKTRGPNPIIKKDDLAYKKARESLSYNKMMKDIEKQEASNYLASLEETVKRNIVDDNKKEKEAQDDLMVELYRVFESDIPTETAEAAEAAEASAEGGSRKKRKTRRKSQRIKTTRRKRKNKV